MIEGFPQPISRERKHRAFTLVELLVVIAILAVAAAFLLPVLQSMRDRGNSVKCMGNLRQLYAAFMAYQGEHNGYFPPGRLLSYSERSDFDWGTHLVPGYIEKNFYCPAMRLNAEGRKKYPDEKKQLMKLAGYSINFYLLQTKMANLPGPHWGGYPYPGNDRMLFLADTTGAGATWAITHSDLALDGYSAVYLQRRSHLFPDGLNFMFLDGHALNLRRGTTDRNDPDSWKNVFDAWGRYNLYVGPKGIPDKS